MGVKKGPKKTLVKENTFTIQNDQEFTTITRDELIDAVTEQIKEDYVNTSKKLREESYVLRLSRQTRDGC
jgi:hypothetical protein